MVRLGVALVLFMAAIAFSAKAQSVNQCIDRCFSTFSPLQNNGSTELRDECLQNCKAPVQSSGVYGAIAFGPRTASWGVAYGMASAAQAQQSAMARCREHGDDCLIAASYANSCAALATLRAKARFTTGQARNLTDAQAAALSACRAQLGAGCQLWVYSCASDTK